MAKTGLKSWEADYADLPEPPVEDEAYYDDLYTTYRNIGLKPEKLRLKADQDRYRKWLDKH
jgi:hypothetical protein